MFPELPVACSKIPVSRLSENANEGVPADPAAISYWPVAMKLVLLTVVAVTAVKVGLPVARIARVVWLPSLPIKIAVSHG